MDSALGRTPTSIIGRQPKPVLYPYLSAKRSYLYPDTIMSITATLPYPNIVNFIPISPCIGVKTHWPNPAANI